MISNDQNSAHVELSTHLHKSILRMTSDELRAFTDALSVALLNVDELAKTTRILVQGGYASAESQDEEEGPELCLLCEEPMLLTSFGDPDEEPVWHCSDCYGEEERR